MTYPTCLTVDYQPNALGQPTQVTDNQGRTYASGVEYHPNGVIKRFTYGNGVVHTMLAGVKDYADYVYDQQNQLMSIRDSAGATVVGFAYDAQGNVRNKNGQLYDFDYGNRLRAATGVETYRYDGLGRRVQSTSPNGATKAWLYSQSGQVVFWSDWDGAGYLNQKTHDTIYLQGSVIATLDRAWPSNAVLAVNYQHTDMLGSPVAVTNASGQVTERNDYEPYGAIIGKPTRSGIGYTGHVMDGSTTLTYMQQRYYDQSVGRFLSVDPITAVGSGDARQFNRFLYAFGNPYRFTDPDGRQSRGAKYYVIGIHTNVNAERSKNSGHAWLSARPLGQSARDTTYGLWPDGHRPQNGGGRSVPDNGAGSDVRVNMEADAGYSADTQRAYFIIDSAQMSALRDYLGSNVQYSTDDFNCTDFALEALRVATGIEIDASSLGSFGISTPSELSRKIDLVNSDFADTFVNSGQSPAVSEQRQEQMVEDQQ